MGEGSLIRRIFAGKLYMRYRSYPTKKEANEAADKLRKQDFNVRIFKEIKGIKDNPYTIYHRHKTRGYIWDHM